MGESLSHYRWSRENSKNYQLRVMLRTEADIYERLEQEENKAAYIKRLIREDIAKSKK